MSNSGSISISSSSSGSVSIRLLTTADELSQGATCLAQCFSRSKYPVHQYICGGDDTDTLPFCEYFFHHYLLAVTADIPDARIWGYVQDDQIMAVAVMLPPIDKIEYQTGDVAFREMSVLSLLFRHKFFHIPFKFGLRTALRLIHVSQCFETQMAEINAVMRTRAYYLDYLGVLPEVQSTGVGSLLLRHASSHRSEPTLPVVISTYAPRAVLFYQRNDSIVVSERVAGPKVWWLVHGHGHGHTKETITLPEKATTPTTSTSTSASWIMPVLGIVASVAAYASRVMMDIQ